MLVKAAWPVRRCDVTRFGAGSELQAFLSAPDRFRFKFGVYWDFVFNRLRRPHGAIFFGE